MADAKVVFDAAEEYERVMGAWSRAAGERFLDWLAPAKGLDWLDLGCGTGAFSEIVLRRCSPASIAGMDPAPAQLDYARRRIPQAEWRVGDADTLPFADSAFDIVASALVLNFIPDLGKALGETRRVLRPGGIVAGYVWERDASTDFSPHVPMERALESIGAEVLRPPSKPASSSDGARDALEGAGFCEISVTTIAATRTFADFEDYWSVQTLLISPVGKSVAAIVGAPPSPPRRGAPHLETGQRRIDHIFGASRSLQSARGSLVSPGIGSIPRPLWLSPSSRARRSNPVFHAMPWIASSRDAIVARALSMLRPGSSRPRARAAPPGA